MLQKPLISLLLFIFLNNAAAYDVTNCGSYWDFGSVVVEGCHPDQDSCKLILLQNTTISFRLNTGDFNIDKPLHEAAIIIHGGIKLPIDLNPVNPCSILTCPVKANYVSDYTAEVYLGPRVPPLSGVALQILLKTQTEEQLLCFQIPVTAERS